MDKDANIGVLIFIVPVLIFSIGAGVVGNAMGGGLGIALAVGAAILLPCSSLFCFAMGLDDRKRQAEGSAGRFYGQDNAAARFVSNESSSSDGVTEPIEKAEVVTDNAISISDAILKEQDRAASAQTVVDISDKGTIGGFFAALSNGWEGKTVCYNPESYRRNPELHKRLISERNRKSYHATHEEAVLASRVAVHEYCQNDGFLALKSSKFICESGERLLCQSDWISLYEPRAVSRSHSSSVGMSCSLGGGWRGYASDTWTESRSHDELTLIAIGSLFITSKRIVFMGDGTVRNIRLGDIMSFQSNWVPAPTGMVVISSQKRSKAMQFEGCGLFYISLIFWYMRDQEFHRLFYNAREEYKALANNDSTKYEGAIDSLQRHLCELGMSCKS